MKFAQSHFQTASRAASARPVLLWLGLVALFALAGCNPRGGVDVPEVDEKAFRYGQQMLRSQQNQVALDAFLKVIEKRDGDAPESHFEAGRIYLNHLNDPYAAIYHFRRFLELKPNSQQDAMVRQMIDTAMKESLKALPGNAMSAEVDRLDLLDMIDRLKKENADLRAEIARMGRTPATPQTLAPTQGAAPPRQAPAAQAASTQAPPSRTPTTTQPAVPVPSRQTQPQTLETLPAEDLPVQPPVLVEEPVAPPPVVRQTPQRPTNPTTTAAAGGTYVVQPKDTLMSISRKLYGTNTRWRDIFEANRDRMKHDADLKIGMELRIP